MRTTRPGLVPSLEMNSACLLDRRDAVQVRGEVGGGGSGGRRKISGRAFAARSEPS
jgi:hypothetical protein